VSKVHDCIDLRFSTLIILHAIWGLVSEYRQLEFVLKIQPNERQGNGALISTSWHQELCQLLDHFSLTVSGFEGGIPEEAILLQELFLMNLHVSFEALQLFAGKEGNEEAHRVYPLLRQWFDSQRSRQAVFHAGQILRAAINFPSNHLRDFYAVACYHAALALWTYGLCSMGSSRTKRSLAQFTAAEMDQPVWVDGEECSDIRRFVAISRGIPMIRGLSRNDGPVAGSRLDNPKATMETIIIIMGKNCSLANGVLPPLVENLRQLMRDLGNAAWIVKSQPFRGNVPD